MDKRYLFQGKRIDGGKWIVGNMAFWAHDNKTTIQPIGDTYWFVDPATVGQCTGLTAAKSYRGDSEDARLIFKGDITELTLPDGESRRFEVDIRTVIREVVSHPDFDAPTAKVSITGIVFLWNGYELFPCVDDMGTIDTSKMSIIGTIHDNAELLDK